MNLGKEVELNQNNSNTILDYIKLCRVKQWIKNGFVGAAVIFSGNLTNIYSLSMTLAVFFIFSFIASTIYIINDILDVEEDKKHPKKRLRPIASGRVSIHKAKFICVILAITSIALSMVINLKLFVVILVYFLTNIIYCFKLKKLMLIDVMTIAFGFILRVLAGSVVINVSLSPWLIICTGLLSLYLGFSKRKNELIVLCNDAVNHRKILSEYSVEFLDRILIVILPITIIAYILYIINGTSHRSMVITIPFVLYGTFRYEYLVINKNSGGSPEDTFIEDRPFLINTLAWILSSILSIYII